MKVYISFSVSQIIDVEPQYEDGELDCDSMIAEALDAVDEPNASNRFEIDGEPEAVVIYGDDGREVWDRESGVLR